MRALWIDPSNKTITEIDIDGKLASIQKHVDGYIELALVTHNHDLYVNEEGLLDDTGGRIGWFMVIGGHQPFAGRGVLLRSTRGGSSAPATMSLEQAKTLIYFPSTIY